MSVATLVDLIQIQRYVFASNRLQDVIGGSALVDRALREFLADTIGGDGEVVYGGGGVGLLRFRNLDDARAFAARYSRALLEQAPGLEVGIVHKTASDGWGWAVVDAQASMEKHKLSRHGHAPLLGLSVTAECVETRRVAGVRDLSGGAERPICTAVAARRQVSRRDRRWEPLLASPVDGLNPRFPLRIEDMGATPGERGLVGVVHVDGNAVGAQLENWLAARLEDGDTERALIGKQRALSRQIEDVFQHALETVVERVRQASDSDGRGGVEIVSNALDRGFGLRCDGGTVWLPVRPILLGGDDLTFLCDGRLALDLARTALEAIRGRDVPELGASLGACAGVAIVGAHAPFSRAYDLARALCESAKTRTSTPQPRPQVCAIDWHIERDRMLESLPALRARQYGVLTMRPYELGTPATQGSFAWLDEELLGAKGGKADGGFQNEFWRARRNKVKALADLLGDHKAGLTAGTAIENALSEWTKTADVGSLPAGLPRTGFLGPCTPLLDAIELLDIHHPLRQVR